MARYHVDRDVSYMKAMWGTTRLITDYFIRRSDVALDKKFEEQEKKHKDIRNDDDYDDWEYGTEPSYGKLW
jgi:hypothetical protein